MELVATYDEDIATNYYNKASHPLVKFTSDDGLYFRYNRKVIEVYDSSHAKIR